MSLRRRQPSHFLSCFQPSTDNEVAPPLRRPSHPNLTTSLYRSHSALFGLTWSRDHLFARSLHIHIHIHAHQQGGGLLSSQPSYHLQIRPWKKRGSRRLLLPTATADVYWDLSRAKFQSGPAPSSGFYVAVLIDGQMALLVGDAIPRATAAITDNSPGVMKQQQQQQVMFLRREHVYGNKQMLYTTKSDFGVTGGAEREITIDCRLGLDDPRLYLSVDKKRVLQIKHLKWKFRGNERIQVEGIPIQVSWDVHSWLFHQKQQQQQQEDVEGEGYAVFMFKFENPWASRRLEEVEKGNEERRCGFGFERKKMKKGLKMVRAGGRGSQHSLSCSSSSLSSASSGCGSVMEWESVEENELKDPAGSALVVYAWKS